jgi:hypothetical protein
MNDGKQKKVILVSTAEFNPCGWRAWLNNTRISLGMLWYDAIATIGV